MYIYIYDSVYVFIVKGNDSVYVFMVKGNTFRFKGIILQVKSVAEEY